MNKKCYICGNNNLNEKDYIIRDDPKLKILECLSCGLLFLSSFSHIDNDYYHKSLMQKPMTQKDPLFRLKETNADDERRYNDFKSIFLNKRLLDYGCGIGGFLFKSSRTTTLSHGVEPDPKFTSFIRNRGYVVFNDVEEINHSDKYDIITMFHVLEHLPDPINNLKAIKRYMGKDGRLIIEIPSSNDALLKLYKNKSFYEFQYKCHLFIYNDISVRILLKRAGYKVRYIKQIQRHPLSNHLYWLCNGKPRGHEIWNFLDSDLLKSEYENCLASLGICDTLIISAYI